VSRTHHLSLSRSLIAAIVAGGAVAVIATGPPAYESIVYPGPGVTFTSTTGINARGDIVGQYVAMNARHGFKRDRHGAYVSIDYPGAAATSAWGINAAGDVAGDFQLPGDPIRGFVLRDGAWTVVDCSASLGAVHTFAFGVSASGEVVGEYKLPGVALGSPGRAYHWVSGICSDITPPAAGTGPSVAVAWSLNESGEAGGYYVAAGVTHGWVRDRQGGYTTVDYPGAAFTNLRGISASGDIVGLFRSGSPANQAFLLSVDGEFGTLAYPSSTVNRALGISARGDVVGDYRGGDCPIVNCGWVLRRSNAAD
jgi:uncharacterized membrane protein